MNRSDEYNELLEELENTPLKLDFTLDRAKLKRNEHNRHTRRAIFTPLGTIAAVFVIFVLLVNVSPTFAYATGRVPLLRDLAKFVAMSPSLSAAVENEYVQPMGLEQTLNGITARVEYVIVDQKQLDIFYTLNSDNYSAMDATPDLMDSDGKFLSECGISTGGYSGNGELRKIVVDFASGIMPDTVKLRLKIRDIGSPTLNAPLQATDDLLLTKVEPAEPVFLFEPEFTLKLDPSFTDKGEVIQPCRSFIMDSQKFILTSAEIYPTHMRFTFDDDSVNTAWMTGIEFYVENEKGERFESVSSGITAFGKIDSPMIQTYMLESPFFSKSDHLTLYITGVTWLDKNMEKVHVDLNKTSADALPEGVKFEQARKMKNGWSLAFSAPVFEENHYYQIWSSTYFDPNGNKYSINSSSTSGDGYFDESKQAEVALPNRFTESFGLIDYPYDEVWLCPSYSRCVTLDTPIRIEIK